MQFKFELQVHEKRHAKWLKDNIKLLSILLDLVLRNIWKKQSFGWENSNNNLDVNCFCFLKCNRGLKNMKLGMLAWYNLKSWWVKFDKVSQNLWHTFLRNSSISNEEWKGNVLGLKENWQLLHYLNLNIFCTFNIHHYIFHVQICIFLNQFSII